MKIKVTWNKIDEIKKYIRGHHGNGIQQFVLLTKVANNFLSPTKFESFSKASTMEYNFWAWNNHKENIKDIYKKTSVALVSILFNNILYLFVLVYIICNAKRSQIQNWRQKNIRCSHMWPAVQAVIKTFPLRCAFVDLHKMDFLPTNFQKHSTCVQSWKVKRKTCAVLKCKSVISLTNYIICEHILQRKCF